jgi:hypothetical protein
MFIVEVIGHLKIFWFIFGHYFLLLNPAKLAIELWLALYLVVSSPSSVSHPVKAKRSEIEAIDYDYD